VAWSLSRPKCVRMARKQGEVGTTALQRGATPTRDDSGSEAMVIAVYHGGGVAVAVDEGKV
jgi:hypothetical protein